MEEHLVHGASWRNCGHDVSAATVGAHRQAAADDLAQRGQVRRHAEVVLCPTTSYPATTTSSHLGEGQQTGETNYTHVC